MKLKTNEQITEAFENEEKTNKVVVNFRNAINVLKECSNDDFEMLQCKIIKHSHELRELQKKHKILTGRNLVVI
jgi:hypothetical protein